MYYLDKKLGLVTVEKAMTTKYLRVVDIMMSVISRVFQ